MADLTEIICILDRSGSMGGLESDTIGGFNAFIEKQRKKEGKTVISVVLFDDRYEILWDGVNACDVKLTEKEYFVRGCTALLDAVGRTILDVEHRLAKAQSEKPDNVIFVIATDGLENASREFTYQRVKELIGDMQEKGWEFIFLAANMDAVKEGGRMGVGVQDSYNFEATRDGVGVMLCIASDAVDRKRTRKKE